MDNSGGVQFDLIGGDLWAFHPYVRVPTKSEETYLFADGSANISNRHSA